MPEWLTELGKASPAAVAVVTVVILFLRFLSGERQQRSEMARECHEVQREGTTAIGAINETNRQVAETNRLVVEALKRLNGHSKGD